MSDVKRREFLTSAAALAAGSTLATNREANGGDPSFMNNVPDPLLAGKDLPTFKFALEKSPGKVIGNSYGKEATVEIWAFDDRGLRATILAPTLRPAGEHALVWDGSAGGRVFGGKRLFDGQYTVALRVQDEAGNVRQREAPLRIANGGIERVEIAEAEIAPARLRLGQKLHLRVRVVNTGETTVRTMGPPPGTEYQTGQPFSALIDPSTTRLYQPVSGAWRVGLGWGTQKQELPLRWGLLADPAASLDPGGEAIVEADVIVDREVLADLPPGAPVRFFVGAVREGVGLSGGRVGDHLVQVDS